VSRDDHSVSLFAPTRATATALLVACMGRMERPARGTASPDSCDEAAYSGLRVAQADDHAASLSASGDNVAPARRATVPTAATRWSQSVAPAA